MVPLAAVAFVSVLHWPQLLALLGLGRQRPDWRLRWKRRPLPWRYTASMLAVQFSIGWLPYVEELWRTVRAEPKGEGLRGWLERLQPG